MSTRNHNLKTTSNWTETIELNSQTLAMYSNDTMMITDDDDDDDGKGRDGGFDHKSNTIGNVDRFKIFDSIENVNKETNLIVLNESKLSKLDMSNLLVIANRYPNGTKPKFRYFLNMMPEIGITACPHCNKVTHIENEQSTLNNYQLLTCFI